MTTNQEGVHAALRAETSTTGTYNEDWSALFDADGVAAGSFNERLLAWINATLGANHASLPAAQQAFAVDQGFANWSAMNTLSLTPGGSVDVILIAGGASGVLLAGGADYIKIAG
jgi:hypothetical protein